MGVRGRLKEVLEILTAVYIFIAICGVVLGGMMGVFEGNRLRGESDADRANGFGYECSGVWDAPIKFIVPTHDPAKLAARFLFGGKCP